MQAPFPSFQPWRQGVAEEDGCYEGTDQLKWRDKGRRNTRKKTSNHRLLKSSDGIISNKRNGSVLSQ